MNSPFTKIIGSNAFKREKPVAYVRPVVTYTKLSIRIDFGLVLIPPATPLCFSPLRPCFFLGADETKTSPVFTDNARTLDSLREAAQHLIE